MVLMPDKQKKAFEAFYEAASNNEILDSEFRKFFVRP